MLQTVGLRQHHCRLCGVAVCDACSRNVHRHPPMGYELAVRACNHCHRQRAQQQADNPRAFDDSQRPLALPFDVAGLGTVAVFVDDLAGRVATVGNDRVVKVWDISAM